MQFRGQDKEYSQKMGRNPNHDANEDEYITNLQQQIHFMELETKILKEKFSLMKRTLVSVVCTMMTKLLTSTLTF